MLYISCHLPWPAISGGRRRELELITRLAPRFEVHLVVVSKTPKQDLANATAFRRHCAGVEVFAARPVAPGAAEGEQPLQLARHRCPAAALRVSEIVARSYVDLIHVEGFYLMQHVLRRPAPPVLLVEQNVEYDLERQRLNGTPSPDGVRRLASTAAAEWDCWRRASKVAAVTEEDRRIIRTALSGGDVRLVPDGADHVSNLRVLGSEPGIEHPGAPLVVLLANYAYGPNVDAAHHLCRDILPLVRARVPEARVWLVGNDPPDDVLGLRSDAVVVTGYVDDVLPYLDAADVVACPLRIGGGIKVKAIEALRRGKAIVSTPVGAQGLAGRAREALWIADDASAFADAVATLLADRDLRAQHERRAARAALRLPTWDQAAARLGDLYDELIEWSPAFAGRAMAGAWG